MDYYSENAYNIQPPNIHNAVARDTRNILDKSSDFIQKNPMMSALGNYGMYRYAVKGSLQRPNRLDGTSSGLKHLQNVPEHLRNKWRVGIPFVSDLVQILPYSEKVNGLTFKLHESLQEPLDTGRRKWKGLVGSTGKYPAIGKGLKTLGAVSDTVGLAQLGGIAYDWIKGRG